MTITINNKNKKPNVPNSTDKGNVIRNVPHLRFPEFEGEWEKCKLGDKCDLLCGYAFDGKNIVEQGTYLLMRGINITEGIIRHSSELDRYYTGSVNNQGVQFVVPILAHFPKRFGSFCNPVFGQMLG